VLEIDCGGLLNKENQMVRKLWIAFLLLAAAAALAQTSGETNQSTSGWTYPVIEDYGPAWPLPDAAVQPQKGRTYKVIFNLSDAAAKANEVLPGLASAARLLNVFVADGPAPRDLRVVAVFHASAGYAPISNEVYHAKFDVDNPNLKIIRELKAAGVQLFLCGQTLHDLNLNERDLLPEVKLATSAAIVLVTYQNDGYALMPF
jgi:intracellular sulfur oxidation DsrE/DsrF family protein